MSNTDLAQFGKIDQTGDPAHFVSFLDAACATESFKVYKRQLLEWMRFSTGRALDVGCGTGDDVREMADAVGSRGHVVGVDNSVAMIDEAKRRAVGVNNVEFVSGEATALPFPDGSFEATRADRSLMHVPDALRVMQQMVRVTRPGGRVVVFEVDFETAVIDVEDRVLTRKVIHTWCDGFRDGWLGRRMPRMFAELGLKEIQLAAHALVLSPPLALPIMGKATADRAARAGTITPEECERWLTQLDELQRRGRFFATLTGFLVGGTRA
jgi:ubiquinone/menaquinone biosynthesis C-methylase UbiE